MSVLLHSGTVPQSLSVMILTFLKGTGQLFCRITLNLVLSEVMTSLNFSHSILGQEYNSIDDVSFTVFHTGRHMLSSCPIIDVNLDYLVKAVSVRFLHYEDMIFSLCNQ